MGSLMHIWNTDFSKGFKGCFLPYLFPLSWKVTLTKLTAKPDSLFIIDIVFIFSTLVGLASLVYILYESQITLWVLSKNETVYFMFISSFRLYSLPE